MNASRMVAGIGPKPVVAWDARLVGGTSTGDSTYWTGLLAGLGSLELPIRLLLVSNAPAPDSIPKHPDVEWVRVPARSSRWWSLVSFPLAARRAGAGVVHAQYTLSPLVGRRGVTTVHDVSFLIDPTWFRPRDRVLLSRLVPPSVARAARVITVSETSRRELEERIPAGRGKTVAIPNAAPAWIRAMPKEVATERMRALGLTGPYVLTVGTRWPRKNMELAVRAVERLPADLPHRLAISGKAGWGSEELGARGQALGYLSEDDLSAAYSAADVYLAPSRHEGFGIPVLEAMVCGCPVMASSGGALPETVGEAGVVERSWDPEQWAATLTALLRDPSRLELLRRRGRERAAEFSWERAARATLAVYEEVLR